MSTEAMEKAVTAMRARIRLMPPAAQEDLETFARAFRNMLAAGPVAKLALLLVASEMALDTAEKKAAGQ